MPGSHRPGTGAHQLPRPYREPARRRRGRSRRRDGWDRGRQAPAGQDGLTLAGRTRRHPRDCGRWVRRPGRRPRCRGPRRRHPRQGAQGSPHRPGPRARHHRSPQDRRHRLRGACRRCPPGPPPKRGRRRTSAGVQRRRRRVQRRGHRSLGEPAQPARPAPRTGAQDRLHREHPAAGHPRT